MSQGAYLKHQNFSFMMLSIRTKLNFYGEEHDVQSHMLRPTIINMQDKYCGDCYDIYLIKSQYKKAADFGRAKSFLFSFVLALKR